MMDLKNARRAIRETKAVYAKVWLGTESFWVRIPKNQALEILDAVSSLYGESSLQLRTTQEGIYLDDDYPELEGGKEE